MTYNELTIEQLQKIAGGGREERQARRRDRAIKRMVRAAEKAEVSGPDGEIYWIPSSQRKRPVPNTTTMAAVIR